MRRLLWFLLLTLTCYSLAYGQGTPGQPGFPNSIDTRDELVRASNFCSTTLTATLSTSDTSAQVGNTSSCPSTGAIVIGSEVLVYRSKTLTSFDQLLHGQDGSAAAPHAVGVPVRGAVVAMIPNTQAGQLIRVQEKLGTSDSKPTGTNIFLQGTGAGSSAWLPITANQISTALGFTPQASDGDLTALAGLSTVGLAKRTGVNAWSIVAAPSGAIVGTSDTQELSNKTLVSSALMSPSISGNSSFSGNITTPGTITANAFVGNCSGCTGITGATGGVSNTGSTTIAADTDANGGVVDMQTRNISRVNVGNTGLIGFGMPGDTGTLYNQAILNLKGRGDENIGGLKIWSTEVTPTPVNFSIYEKSVANTVGSRRMQGYYMGTNAGLSGREYPTKGQILDGWEINWDSGNPNAPVQERWTLITGDNGVGQRTMFYYSPLNNPELTHLEWSLNAIHFEDWATRTPWMTFTPGKISLVTTAISPNPRIETDSGSPLIFRGEQAYPFINSSSETEISRDTQLVRFMSGHETIDPAANYRFVLGPSSDSTPPELRFNVSGSGNWEFSNGDGSYIKFSEGTKGLYRQWYNLAAAAGSYTTLGSIGPNFASERPLTFTVVISEHALGTSGGGKVFHVLTPTFGTQNVWKEVLPITAATGLGADTGLALDVKTDSTDNSVKLRVRRATLNSVATPFFAEIRVYDRTGAFTLSTETGTGASISDTLQIISASTKVQTLVVDLGGGVTISKGAGAPSGACITGSTYHRTNGGAGSTFYVCESSTWAAK